MTSSPETRRAWLAWFAICLIWGTTYLAIKIAIDTIPALLIGGLRYLAAALIMVVVLRAQGRRLPPLAVWPTQAVLGFSMLALGNGGVVVAEQYLTSGMTAVLVGTSPFWMVAIDAAFPGGKRLRLQQVIGMTVGFAGIVMLVWPDLKASASMGSSALHGSPLTGIIAVQIACIGWSIASSYSKRYKRSTDVLGTATLQMMFGGIFMTLAATVQGDWVRLSFSPASTAALAYLIVLGSVVAFVAYSYALKHLPISVVSLYTYVNPVIAVALGALLLHEPFGGLQITAAVVIAIGMLIVRSDRGLARVEGEVS